LRPYTFSKGGPFVAAGNVACIPSHEMMHDATAFPEPERFNGSRFVANVPGNKLTDVTDTFLSWGYGSLAW
jgi:cytochrome P450